MHAEVIDDQLVRIKNDLASQGLTYEHLQEDILDHICCMVEEDLETGIDFESSYRNTMSEIGENTLSHLQHQTLILLDRKFQRMKKTTYITGLTGSLLAMIGVLFKMMHWPAASILLTLGFIVVVLVFLPMYFISSYKEMPEKPKIIFPAVAYLSILVVFTGAVFKIMHWPGAAILLKASVVVLLVGFLPLYIVQIFKKVSGKRVNIAYVVMLLVGLSIVLILGKVNISKNAIDRFTEITLKFEKSVDFHRQDLAELMNHAGDSLLTEEIRSIHEDSEHLLSLADQMLDGLLQKVDREGIPIQEVNRRDRRNANRDAFINNGLAAKFKTESRELHTKMSKLVDDPSVKNELDLLFMYADERWVIGWTFEDYAYEPLIYSYYKISGLKHHIAVAEKMVMMSLLE